MSNHNMLQQLYTLLEQNLFYGDRLSERQFVTLVTPGQFVSTNMKTSNLNDQWAIWNLTNKVLDTTFQHKHQASTVSGLYEEILEFAALPKKQLTPDQEAHQKELEEKMDEIYPVYDKWRKIYEKANRAITRELAKPEDEQDQALIVDLRKDAQKAYKEWTARGKRQEYEDLYSEFEYLLSANPRRLWSEIKSELQSFKRQAPKGTYYETHLNPHPGTWDKSGWTELSLGLSSNYNREYSRSTSFSAGGSGGWGLWRAGGSYSENSEHKNGTSRVSSLNISLEYLVVDIERPWMKSDLFDRRYWTWRKGLHEYTQISDGGNMGATPPIRPVAPRGMPFLPTQFFIVRNVELAGDWKQEDYDYYNRQVSASASVGWGPFSASGSYSEGTTQKTYSGSFANGKLTIEQPQIFAIFGTLLNLCPNPDRALSWVAGEPDFGDGMSLEQIAEIREAREVDFVEASLRRRMNAVREAEVQKVEDRLLKEYVRAYEEDGKERKRKNRKIQQENG